MSTKQSRQSLPTRYKVVGFIFLISLVCMLVVIYFSAKDVVVLNPQGSIAAQQKELLIIATLLMLLVVIPVFLLTFFIVWKYREGNNKAKYQPNWDHSRLAETIWWGFPLLIIGILAVITWISTHELDPYRPIESSKNPVEVQVVALEWRWLFIYPEHDVASLNYLQIPEKTPINFTLTSDAPMNSFWIPSLGGQVYAMSGMSTKLHLQAHTQGIYEGSSANLSGEGFAGMRFQAESVSNTAFTQWVQKTQSEQPLNEITYATLSKPSTDTAPRAFSLDDPSLYDKIVMKYNTPSKNTSTPHHSEGSH